MDLVENFPEKPERNPTLQEHSELLIIQSASLGPSLLDQEHLERKRYFLLKEHANPEAKD